MASDNVGACIQRAERMIERVEKAIDDLDGPDLDWAHTSVFLIAVFGHAVTQILHNIKTFYDREHVEEWWAPWQLEMRRDPMLRFFWDMRTSFLKKGVIGGPGMVGEPQEVPPPYWRWRFIIGGGWEIDHLGSRLVDPSVDEIGRLYADYLRRILVAAIDEFHEGVPLYPSARIRASPMPRPGSR